MGLDGRLMLLKSSKGFSKARLSMFMLEHGRPVIIASDKNPPPRMLEKTASLFSSWLICPEGNMSRLEKARMARNFSASESFVKWKNQHEKDALVAALIAWKRIAGLMGRVDARLRKSGEGGSEASDAIKSGVILRRQNIDKLIKEYQQLNKRRSQL